MKLSFRSGGGNAIGWMFLLTLVVVLPFGIGPEMHQLGKLAPSFLWIATLLATLLGADQLFKKDCEDGSFDIFFMRSIALEWIILVKILAHWIATSLPLVLSAFIFGFFLNIAPECMGPIVVTLFAGTPAMTFFSAIGAALGVLLRRDGLFASVLIIPFTIPILIFGVAATKGACTVPVNFSAPFFALCLLTGLSAIIAPIAIAAVLRLSFRS